MPLDFPENPKLGRFVNSVRAEKARGALSQDRIESLERLGFKWNSHISETNYELDWLEA